jgi:protein Mpv17
MDQTVGATLNTLAFSLGMAALRGAHWPLAVQIARQEFWSIMRAGWMLWPMVSILNYVFVKSVAMRSLLANLAGVAWSIYLSLLADV